MPYSFSNSDDPQGAQGSGTKRARLRHDSVARGNVGTTGRKGSDQSFPTRKPSHQSLHTFAPMGSQQSRPQTPEIQFRVLIIGRANAGKTAILQRVCETTESPIIYRGKGSKEEVCRPTVCQSAYLVSFPTRSNLTRPWKLVTVVLLFGCL